MEVGTSTAGLALKDDEVLIAETLLVEQSSCAKSSNETIKLLRIQK